MATSLKAVELEGIIDENRQLKIEGDLPIQGPQRVHIILLYPGDEDDDIDEEEWLYAAAHNPAFAFLKDDVTANVLDFRPPKATKARSFSKTRRKNNEKYVVPSLFFVSSWQKVVAIP